MGVTAKKAKIFKIKNRKGFGCVCMGHLTEGKTMFEAHQRMQKALKRSGIKAKELNSQQIKTRCLYFSFIRIRFNIAF